MLIKRRNRKMSKTYAYIRVSTKDQNEERQRLAMAEFGVPEKNVISDKRLMRKLKAGDILVVKSIDRLGRNYDEILEQWRIITKEKSAAIVVLDMPLLDTRQGKDLTGSLISDIVLQLLSYVAETERELIRQRQVEGIAAAKAMGRKLGRPFMERSEEFESVRAEWQQGRISAREASRRIGVSHVTFLKWVRSEA